MKKSADRIRTKGDGIRVVEHGKGRGNRAAAAVVAVFVMTFATSPWWSGSSTTEPPSPGKAESSSREHSQDPQAERSRRHVSVRAARSAPAPTPASASLPLLDDKTMEQLIHGTPETLPERSREEDATFEKTARELIQAAQAAGETRGIAAFPPPGTDPIKVGLVVPPGYELPEGFLRHHQMTDDGRRLEPILMFSPDYQFVDANGQPVVVPEDGIVPAEMAPPGLPMRVLAVPKNAYGPSAGAN